MNLGTAFPATRKILKTLEISIYILYSFSRFWLLLAQNPASRAPETLCQMLKIAPGSALSLEKYLIASTTLSPEFYIPTSMLMVRAIRSSNPSA